MSEISKRSGVYSAVAGAAAEVENFETIGLCGFDEVRDSQVSVAIGACFGKYPVLQSWVQLCDQANANQSADGEDGEQSKVDSKLTH